MTHHLSARLDLPLPIDRVFAFFGDPSNLERITPPELHFRILTPTPIVMAPGTLIDYRLQLLGARFKWRTEITEWEPPHRFVDVQLQGPYREWVHTHRFVPTDGGTTIFDDVQYRLPLSPLGDLAYPIVRLQLARIFSYRTSAVLRLLNTATASAR
jgi:ligand-binding SRPBCC domain-containing protein